MTWTIDKKYQLSDIIYFRSFKISKFQFLNNQRKYLYNVIFNFVICFFFHTNQLKTKILLISPRYLFVF